MTKHRFVIWATSATSHGGGGCVWAGDDAEQARKAMRELRGYKNRPLGVEYHWAGENPEPVDPRTPEGWHRMQKGEDIG